jgi:3-(methylthio)propionyl---CoA ligase
MLGRMMQMPLLVSSILRHGERHHGDTEVVSRRVEGDIHRTTYSHIAERSRQVANMLATLGITKGDRVATIAWNGYRHLELYYGVSGSGAILHTINPRLHIDQLVYIINHADDRIVCFDATFAPLAAAVATKCPRVAHWIVMSDANATATQGMNSSLHNYEEIITAASSNYAWPDFDENTASSLCYTSGTSGNPKGVLYSHRSTVLHTYASALPDSLCLSATDCILPVVPMFHVNAWGLPYSALAVGAKLVFPGPALDGASLYDLFEREQVTCSAGVPTVWQGLLNHVRSNNLRFSSMKRTVIGGSACSPAMIAAFQDDHDVRVLHAWGMTELSPIGSVGVEKAKHKNAPPAERRALQTKQGRGVFGIDMKIVDSMGNELAWDGATAGDLWVRGGWTVSSYFEPSDSSESNNAGLVDGWFATGDVATIDSDGYMHITDRSKDVIKSGGEWISSIAIENVAMSHPSVAMAACIGISHPKWDERPLLVVVRKPDQIATREQLLEHFSDKIAKWWIPDDVVFVDAIPLGATGKMLKAKLREQFRDHRLPS